MRLGRPVRVIGAGLAGSQAALTIARLGGDVVLDEMRPARQTPAHRTALAAELVCSNSLRSDQPQSAPGLLKQELRLLDSELIRIAQETAVPAGTSLAVDRDAFSQKVTAALQSHPRIRLQRQEVDAVPTDAICVIATGPLTGERLAHSIQQLTGEDNLSFFDALNPIVDADTIDRRRTFSASRYDKGDGDYLNCPLTREEYAAFRDALIAAERYRGHDFDRGRFLGCPPLEVLAESGADTLRYGPLKPVGLIDPATGSQPYAVVQLRRENLRNDSFNLVGCQNQMTYGHQQRVFRLIPALAQVEFVRFGQMHRNTYLRAPRLLSAALHLHSHPDVFIAGQLAGVEGYVESIATGLVASVNAWRRSVSLPPITWPRESGLGAICHYLAHAEKADFAPVRLTFDLLPTAGIPNQLVRNRQMRREFQCGRALDAIGSVARQVATAFERDDPLMPATTPDATPAA